jgi:hypothetical protein
MSKLKKNKNKYDRMLDEYLLKQMSKKVKKLGIKGTWKHIEKIKDPIKRLNSLELLINILADKSAERKRKKISKTLKELKRYTPSSGLAINLSKARTKRKAEVLALHFAGYTAKPIGIEDNTYYKCYEAYLSCKGNLSIAFKDILKILKKKK